MLLSQVKLEENVRNRDRKEFLNINQYNSYNAELCDEICHKSTTQ